MQRAWQRAVAVLVMTAAVACTSPGPDAPSTGDSSQDTTAPPSEEAVAAADAAQLRLDLEAAVARHTVLTLEAMRAAADGNRHRSRLRQLAEDTVELIDDALSDFAADASGLSDAWSQRTDALLALATEQAGATGDLADAQAALGEVAAEIADLDPNDVEDTVVALDDDLRDGLTAHVGGDFTRSYTLQRQAFSGAVSLAENLAVAIAGTQGAADATTTGRVELHSAMRQLVGEHTTLALITSRRAARGAKDFAQAAAALNGNTEDLTAALLGIYDEDVAVAFDEDWRELIAGVVGVTVAAAEEAPRRQRTARRELRDVVDELADQLDEMTEGTIEAAEAAEVLAAHVAGLHQQGTAVARGRWDRADDATVEALDHSAELADLIAGGIADHLPGDFPD